MTVLGGQTVLPCPQCQRFEDQLHAAHAHIELLQARVRDLEERLGQNASNSSIPPSANPPTAPKPVLKRPTGRTSGAQPGHPAHRRTRLPPERVNRIIPFVPSHCQRCHEPLPPNPGPDDPEPTWHQVIELPPLAAEVLEYQGHFRTCPACGTCTHAAIPHDLKAHSIGARLAGFLAYLTGRHHVSQRGLEELVEDVFEIPLALGTVVNLQAETSEALAPAQAEALEAVRVALVKNVDETGWKRAGKLCWLWIAATDTVAAFLIQAHRSWKDLVALLGSPITGYVISDRWSAYNRLSRWWRQLCWAHLKRDFQKLVDRGGLSARLGEALLAIAERVFHEWHLFRGGGIDRRELQTRLEEPARQFEALLQEGSANADAKTATFCANVLALLPAVWRFVWTEGIEPTNNHGERLLRLGVLWRKNSFGSASPEGCRFVERVLTVVQTCRLQQRSVLGYLHAALLAHRNGLPAPSLLSAG